MMRSKQSLLQINFAILVTRPVMTHVYTLHAHTTENQYQPPHLQVEIRQSFQGAFWWFSAFYEV